MLLIASAVFLLGYQVQTLILKVKLFHTGSVISEPVFHLLLPVGISFWIFQNIAYLVDVYKSKIPAEKSLGRYLLFIGYFPKLSVGPIERGENLLLQIPRGGYHFAYDRTVDGLQLVMIGLFKKIAVADTIAPIVNNVYDNCTAYIGLALLLSTVLYAFQIYCDFSGYTDMAIGFSEMLGIRLMENFRCPYLSKSISEFWRRWHISLATWFRDYVYIPLGGNRVKHFSEAVYIITHAFGVV